tara:strand:- start:486 stop:1217 length:732 start_codon:yes stop_codon:yes gene_type:complete
MTYPQQNNQYPQQNNQYPQQQQGGYPGAQPYQQGGHVPQQPAPFVADDDDLDMNATIENDGKDFKDFVIAPAGYYDFYVVKYETQEYTDKNVNPHRTRKRIIVTIQFEFQDEKIEIKEYFPLKKSMEWKFCQFFKCIGDRKHGEPLVMDWQNCTGKRGKVKIKIDDWENKNGDVLQSNKVDKYIDPADAINPANTTQAPANYLQPNAQPVPPPNYQQPPASPLTQPINVQGTPPPADGGAWQQ